MSATSIRVWQTQNAGADVPAPHERASRAGAPRLDAHYALLAGVMLVYLHNTLPYLTTLPRVNVDEPWLMERAYQVMRTGVPNQPMLGLQHAYLLQIGYGYLLAGWMTLFGVGVLQARLFGVVLGAAIVILVAWIGRRTIDSTTGVSAALFLALDSNFLGGVRNARTDIPSVFFVVAAFAAYLQGRRRSHAGWFVCAGASLGLAVLCHGNAFWAGVILLAWYVLDYGRRAVVLRYGYAVLLGVLLTFGPYLAVVLARWADVQVQIGNFAADRVPGWQPAFVLGQTLREIQRYRGWYFGLVTSVVPNPLLLAFQLLIALGIVALAVRSLISRTGHTRVPADPRGAERLLILAIGGAFMFAAFINNKVPVYMPHLLVGFALAAGVAVSEALSFVPARRRALVTLSFVVAYGGAGVAYFEKWYATAGKSELVSYEATTGTLRALVPPGPKYVYASPQFWPPFHAEPLTTFYSYAAAHPVDSGSAAILAGAGDDRPIFLIVDEFQWLPELTGVSSSMCAGRRRARHGARHAGAVPVRSRGRASEDPHATHRRRIDRISDWRASDEQPDRRSRTMDAVRGSAPRRPGPTGHPSHAHRTGHQGDGLAGHRQHVHRRAGRELSGEDHDTAGARRRSVVPGHLAAATGPLVVGCVGVRHSRPSGRTSMVPA
ncbi:MAG: hypothetical protein DMF98_17745 [Acidobacteria bacterium]|nr:MAG: hypothetical protein DMF98_17745 [Acidobacteriota bacterium]